MTASIRMRVAQMGPDLFKDEVAELLRMGARVVGWNAERFHEAGADAIICCRTSDDIDREAKGVAKMCKRSGHTDGIVRAKNVHLPPCLQFGISQDRLDAVLTHDAIAGFRDDQVDTARRQTPKNNASNPGRSLRTCASHTGIGEIKDRFRAVIAHGKDVAQEAHASELGAAHFESFL